ncbi:MAG: 50S ribosomal protein L10 [Clostridia bacterium]
MASEKILDKKKKQVEVINKKLIEAGSFVLADYRGLTVEQDTKLRAEMRKAGVDYSVIKNSILRFAIQGTAYESLESYLEGPTAVAFSDDQVKPAKILLKFAKDFKVLEIKAGAVDGNVINLSGVELLANLPSKEELIAKMLGSMNRPVTGLVYVLSANIRGLAVALQAIVDQKQSESA